LLDCCELLLCESLDLYQLSAYYVRLTCVICNWTKRKNIGVRPNSPPHKCTKYRKKMNKNSTRRLRGRKSPSIRFDQDAPEKKEARIFFIPFK
jgi:hypothetical protein